MTRVNELSDYNPDGTRLGQAATDKIAFFGANPIAQRSSSTMTATTYTVKNTACFGFTTSAKFNAFKAEVEEIRATLVALGLHKGS